MRKEITFAIILGILLGSIIIYGLRLANQAGNQNNQTTIDSSTAASLTPNSTQDLTITTPEDNSVAFDDTLTLKGTARPQANVAIITEVDDFIIQADDLGSFQQEIELVGGENNLSITATDGQDYTQSLNLTVIYTTAQID